MSVQNLVSIHDVEMFHWITECLLYKQASVVIEGTLLSVPNLTIYPIFAAIFQSDRNQRCLYRRHVKNFLSWDIIGNCGCKGEKTEQVSIRGESQQPQHTESETQTGRGTDGRAEYGRLRGINERICVHGRAFFLTTGCFVKKSSVQTCVCCWVNSHYPSHSICCFITSPGLKLNVFIMKPRCREKKSSGAKRKERRTLRR